MSNPDFHSLVLSVALIELFRVLHPDPDPDL